MKCPKCGYLGFETTDRCRNCGYDFSLAPFPSEPELPLRGENKSPSADFDLPAISKPKDSMAASSLDLDRLFGAETAPEPQPMASLSLQTPVEAVPIAPVPRMRPPRPRAPISPPLPDPEAEAVAPVAAAPMDAPPAEPQPPRVRLPNTQVVDMPARVREEPDYTLNANEIRDVPLDLSSVPTAKPPSTTPDAEAIAAFKPTPTPPPMAVKPEPDTLVPEPVLKRAEAMPVPKALAEPAAAGPVEPVEPVEPVIAPPPAKPPLAVRRSTPEVQRGRPRSTPRKIGPTLEFEPPKPAVSTAFRSVTSIPEVKDVSPSVGSRVAADLIDLMLLVAIDLAVLVLTLRILGLAMVWDDLRVLPPVPFVGFLALLAFGYLAAFTVAGGQTIGKMLMSIKVIGDDCRAVDAAGGVLRALGCALVPLTLGLSYLPVLVTSDQRALHDRLAGTRVIRQWNICRCS
jgi:uncharacterized RDD family membrane protein YckC